MKTIQLKSVKKIGLLILGLFIISACTNTQKESTKKQPESVSLKAKAPKMDIHTATFMGDLKVIQQHILAGTNLNTKDQYGSSPIIIATTFGKTEVAKALIQAGADLTCTNNEGSTPLHVASFFCRTEIVKALLKKGADKNLKNNFGSTALESLTTPFENVKPIYDQISKDLGPLGLKLDYEQLKATRPIIAVLLKYN